MTSRMLLQASASHLPLADESVQCVVTSPPYWGLRQYAGEQVVPSWGAALGLEPTPEQYVEHMVEVFREVRRVLRKDGTLWLNLGDSYTSGGRDRYDQNAPKHAAQMGNLGQRPAIPAGLKAKDLVGIPWMVAKALQAPYYTGRIGDERDRVWLAAMLDAEGCMFIHRRKAGQNAGGGYERKNDTYSPALEISNTSAAVMDRIAEIVGGKGSVATQGPEQNGRRRQTIFRWSIRSNEARALVRELYPHLVAKQQQARIFLGCPTSGDQASAAHLALMGLHRGSPTDLDYPTPASMYEPGWYLRSDIVWAKPNPMPESVTDRPTKSHEYVFLLAKSERYFYDADAIREPHQMSSWTAVGDREGSTRKGRGEPTPKGQEYSDRAPSAGLRGDAYHERGRNKRTVWTIATRPYPGAHFATYPEQLVEPCILAGTSPKACGVCGAPWARVIDKGEPELQAWSAKGAGQYDDSIGGSTCEHNDDSGTSVVLDPFNGSGTTGRVAIRHGRSYIGVDISREYLAEQAQQRIDNIQHVMHLEAAS